MPHSFVRVLAGAFCCAAGCSSNPPDDATVEQGGHGPPRIGATPAWEASGPVGAGGCFGGAVAVGDLDGDGERDLIVGEPNCFFELVTPGRIAIYRGDGTDFADTPVWTDLTWTNPPRGGTSMSLSTGDVDGDGRDDLLVNARGGAQVFAGITSLAAPLGAPAYRVPGTGTFGSGILADVDGNGRHEILSTRANAVTVWRANGGTLVSARVITPASQVVAAGDTNDDDRDDVIITTPGHSDLYRGCSGAGSTCSGGLRTAPAWGSDLQIAGMVPDVNHDGFSEALLGSGGRVWLHLSAGGAALEPIAIWSSLADPNYPSLGRVVRPGDLDGDHKKREFLVSAAGRIYAFFPRPNHLDELDPGFAWPRQNLIQDQLLGGESLMHGSLTVTAAGKVNGDKYADIVIGATPEFDDPRPGQVFLFRGGKLPPPPMAGEAPFLPGERTCALPAAPCFQ
jgi:hypothetical protein